MDRISSLLPDGVGTLISRAELAVDEDMVYGKTKTRDALLERDQYRCVVCGSTRSLHQDHIWPRSRGGTDDIGNLQVLCRNCNLSKSDRWFDLWLPDRLGEIGRGREPVPACPWCYELQDKDPYDMPHKWECRYCGYECERGEVPVVQLRYEKNAATRKRNV